MQIKTMVVAFGLVVCLLTQPVVAGQLEDALAAFDRSDYDAATQL